MISTKELKEEATITEVKGNNKGETLNESVRTTPDENLDEDKTSSYSSTSCNLEVSDNINIIATPPIESPLIPPTFPPVVVGYNPRKVGRYNLRPNRRQNVNPDFRMLDSVTKEDLCRPQY